MPSHCWVCGRPLPCPFLAHNESAPKTSELDGYDRNGALGADGNVYSDADPGL